ncbi:Os09g0505900, partial [Oryza sativa Japonica Group]
FSSSSLAVCSPASREDDGRRARRAPGGASPRRRRRCLLAGEPRGGGGGELDVGDAGQHPAALDAQHGRRARRHGRRLRHPRLAGAPRHQRRGFGLGHRQLHDAGAHRRPLDRALLPCRFKQSSSRINAAGEDEAPAGLPIAPIKYKFANISPSFMSSGSGDTSFLLINQRYDYAFGLFSGGKDNPKLVAVSNKISFANPKAPVFPRLSQGKGWNEMAVTWTSGYNVDEAYPFVEWTMNEKENARARRSPADTLTFTRNHLCGKPANAEGYRDPGFIHTAFLKNLWPNREYSYQIGHELLDGTIVWGKSSTFRASPSPGQASLQRIVIFGDMGLGQSDGSNELAGFQPGAQVTTERLIKDLPNYDAVFHIGDLSYANGFLAQWDQFTAQISPVASRVPYMVASGNHERTSRDTGGFYGGDDSHGECGVPAETYFRAPAAANRGKPWYAADHGMFRFCVGDTEHDWRPGTAQHAFLDGCFAAADRKHQPWLVFAAHRPLGYSSNEYYAREGSFSEPMGRTLQPLWQKHRVDLAVYGHVHNYERTCPLAGGGVHRRAGRHDPRRGRHGRRQAEGVRRRRVAAVERGEERELRVREAHGARPLAAGARVHPQRRRRGARRVLHHQGLQGRARLRRRRLRPPHLGQLTNRRLTKFKLKI